VNEGNRRSASTGLIAIAPHGVDIEAYTDQQAERVTSQVAGKGVSSWRCKGWHPKGAFDHWHITSTDIHEASSVISRHFSYAVTFHGFDDANIPYDILVGGLACEALKEKVKGAIEGVVGSDFTVHITKPDERFGGEDKRNIVSRLTAGGRHGIQIEQKKRPSREICAPHRRCSRQRLRLRVRATLDNERTISQQETKRDTGLVTPSQGNVVATPPTNEPPCPTCTGAAASIPVSHVYPIGRIEARFPRLSVEKEFTQATRGAETAGQTDSRRSTKCSPNPRTGISLASCAGC